MSETWIRTFTGIEFDIIDPKPEMVCIEDIAHALSMVCRFSGHVKQFYSVAQHCYLGSLRVEPEIALEFLLHDATEAYIGDMSRPLKHLTSAGVAYQQIEARIDNVIREKFHLAEKACPEIHLMDDSMLLAEKEQLMSPGRIAMKPFAADAAKVSISYMSPTQAETLYLQRFYTLAALRREEIWVS